ncbi:alpha/beta hydrolase protein [Rhizophagus clarus]|nr:alpha/beta hydrolase protein [Rhizophagus clarus]
MINELEKHVDELARSQDQISTLNIPRDIANKLKKDKNSLYKQKVPEEIEFESDATTDDSDEEEEQGYTEEPESMIPSDKSGQKENDLEKVWKEFDWSSNVNLITMKSQSLRNSYRNSGSFIRNSFKTTRNSSLQYSRINNSINIQQWKKENQTKDSGTYNSRRIYNFFPVMNRSDTSVDGSGGILIKKDNNLKSCNFEFDNNENEEMKKLSIEIDTSPQALLHKKNQFGQEPTSSSSQEISEDSLLSSDALPDNMLVRIAKIDFNPPRSPNSRAKTSIRLVIHSVTHHTKPNSSYQEQLKKMFLFPFDYHSFVFDALKIDIYEHASFLYAKKKLGRVIIRLNTLKDSISNQKDFEGNFPLELGHDPHSQKVGTIDIAIKFHFPDDPPLLPSKTLSQPNPLAQTKPVIARSKTAPALLSSSNNDQSKQILPPAVTNTREIVNQDINQEISSEIEEADEGEFANITHPEIRPLGILDRVLNQETRDAIKEITVLYHAFFDHGWRLSKLEFLKAYMLLEKYYSQKPNQVTGCLSQDIERIQIAQKYLKYSMASYGSFLFHWFGYGHNMAPLNAIRINSDRKAVQEFFSLEKDDIICWEYGQKAVSVPNYMVIHDPESNSIIISIRGTMNVTDVITDALAHYEPWNGGFVHRGVLRSAQYLVNHSLNDILEAVKKFKSNAIKIIGHSLGASVSAIVTLLLREKCKDLIEQGIDIHAWNFATAPCCSLDLACKAETESCVDNFVNENDVIPRLSYGNLMDFKELIKFAASELKNEKYKKLSSKDKLAKILTSIDDYRTTLKSNSSAQKLYIPGTIYYLYKGFHRSHIKSSIAFYTKDIVCEKSRPELFTDISLRRNWLFHHFPDRYDKKFKGVTKFLLRKLNEKDDGDKGNKLLKKWKKVAESDVVNDEGGRMGKWMSRSGHI